MKYPAYPANEFSGPAPDLGGTICLALLVVAILMFPLFFLKVAIGVLILTVFTVGMIVWAMPDSAWAGCVRAFPFVCVVVGLGWLLCQ